MMMIIGTNKIGQIMSIYTRKEEKSYFDNGKLSKIYVIDYYKTNRNIVSIQLYNRNEELVCEIHEDDGIDMESEFLYSDMGAYLKKSGDRRSDTFGFCKKCSRKKNLDYYHIKPISQGGTLTWRNVQLLCEKCR